MMNIVFLDKKTIGNVDNFNLLHKLGNVEVFDQTGPDQVIDRCKAKDIIITNKVVINRQVIDALPSLKLICVAATGVNNVDVEYAKEKGIEVRNVVAYSTDSVAQSTFSMLLFLLNRLSYYDAYVKSGAYARSDIFTHHGPAFWELAGKRFGIIGLGNIGRRVARIAEGFGMEVVFYSTTGRNNNINYKRFDLDTLLKTSDVVSIHSPLSETTRDLINYSKLKLMRPCAILLNTGRGGIVNEADLARALNENVIAAAGIDVLEREPISSNNPLLKIYDKDKILLTPHIAWASMESRARLVEKVAKNIEAFKREQGY
ncbi:MAG: hydroxyacid dehydrogenase [Bacteroides sp. SM23_62_1]|nr:MAG: hydroxyacid dehydrogenase [Bacteroides sp. SM23_62_1]